jgi:hypothetical protein
MTPSEAEFQKNVRSQGRGVEPQELSAVPDNNRPSLGHSFPTPEELDRKL